nr:hypothetical protein 11 [Campylobacterota bacterium]
MTFETANGARLNTIIGKSVFSHNEIDTDEVKMITGLSIKELIMCWIFDPRNDFQKHLIEWRENGKLMNFEEIQGH